jgi:hypothetical protein
MATEHVLRSDAAADVPRDAPTQVLLHGMAAGGVLMLDLTRPVPFEKSSLPWQAT